MTKFAEPFDVPDAEWRLGVLLEEVERIQVQLDDPSRKSERESGRPLSAIDYNAWRKRASDAMYHKKNEAGYIRAWLQREGITLPDEIDSNDVLVQELLDATEEAVPTIYQLTPPSLHPTVDRMLKAFGMITGSNGDA